MFELFPFVVGFFGSFHCLGMCGPLVLAYSLNLKSPEERAATFNSFAWRSGCLHHLAFHFGRLLMYGFLGAAAAGLFHAADLSRLFSHIRGSMLLAVGILLIFLSLILLKLIPTPNVLNAASFMTGSFFARRLHPLFRSRSLLSKMILGLAVGTLPCCLSWAMIITASTTHHPLKGFYTMTAFGLGTLPSLFLMGISASFLSVRVRLLGERMAALSVMALGLVLAFRGAGSLV